MKTLILKTKKRVFGSLIGRHSSTFKGNGLDFKELREYVYGEDAKKIDWKISAKFQKPFVKEFEEDRELNILICILANGSFHFGSYRLKTELIAEITALLGFSAVKYDDKVSLIIYEKKPLFHSKPTKNIKSIPVLIEKTASFEYLKKEYNFSFIDYLNKFKKSILFLIGDFYSHPPIKKLKHETFLIWIRDKFEENPKELGEIELIDPLNLKKIHTVFSKENIKEYEKKIKEKDSEFIAYLKKEKIKFTKIYTDEDPFFKLTELVK
ncbi:MAG: DUF58 domain-containing protein [Nautiliaceae bacterium]